MSARTVIVVGAGGHGLVVADALLAAGHEVLGFVDEDAAKHGSMLLGRPVLGGDDTLINRRREDTFLANGMGGHGGPGSRGATWRHELQRRLEARGWRFLAVRHPSACVSTHAVLDEGSQVLAGAVVQAAARVGVGAIVNTRAIVEHDCDVGMFAHIAPGAILCGGVRVGELSHVGAGAVVIQGRTIGSGVVVGAGAAVTVDVAQGRVAGVPARQLESGA